MEITSITGDGECDLGNPEYGDCENLVVEANGFTREVYSKVDVYQVPVNQCHFTVLLNKKIIK